MTVRRRLSFTVLLGGVLLVGVGAGGAAGTGSTASASARAFSIRVIVPGQSDVGAGSVSAPPYHVSFGDGFAYPADGSAVTTGALTSSAQSDAGTRGTASAAGEARTVSVFGGEVTVETASARAAASTRGYGASGSLARSSVTGLSVLGQPVTVAPNARVALADWGYLTTLQEGTDASAGSNGAKAYHGFVTAIDVQLTAAHGSLPAGSEIQIGYAEVTVQAPARQRPKTKPRHRSAKRSSAKGKDAGQQSGRHGGTGPFLPVPTNLQPTLTADRYVFPVYGPVSFSNTFGAFRGDVPGNWHHGDDIFAPLGAPILACADGTVFSVGWQEIGGNRLWLRDSEGNEFYYAHLSAFSPLARNGSQVSVGDVLGFVGNTGDASGTPTHLHFEIHPTSLLFMGYDGAVNPTPYLTAWQHLHDVNFEDVAGWVPAAAVSDPAPKPAAILLQVKDISEASGLDPGSLQRALAARGPGEGDQALLRALGFRPPHNAGSDR